MGTVGGKKAGELPSRLYVGEEVYSLNQQREVEDLTRRLSAVGTGL